MTGWRQAVFVRQRRTDVIPDAIRDQSRALDGAPPSALADDLGAIAGLPA